MHVDTTLPMWAFFDIYGNTQKIKILGKHTDGAIFRLIMYNAQKLGVMFYHAKYLCLYVKKFVGVRLNGCALMCSQTYLSVTLHASLH